MAIKLGGGGGGGAEIGDVKYIANTDNLITTDSGEKWQKSGVSSNVDTTTYPDAPVFYGPISSTADAQVNKSGGGSVWYDQNGKNSSCTNGEYIWSGRGDGNNIIYKWSLTGSATQSQVYNGTDYTYTAGPMMVHAHSDGKLYSAHCYNYGSSGHRYNQLQEFSIDSNGDLTLDDSTFFAVSNSGGPFAWVRASGYNDRMWIVGDWGGTLVDLVDLSGNVYSSERITISGTALQTRPYETKSAHVFNGKYILVGDRGDAYVYTLDWQFVEKITTGVPNNYYFFSKTDTTATDLSKDNYGSIAESASGVNNYQRMYEITSTGYKNHPASTHIGSEDERLDGTGVNQYVRIL